MFDKLRCYDCGDILTMLEEHKIELEYKGKKDTFSLRYCSNKDCGVHDGVALDKEDIMDTGQGSLLFNMDKQKQFIKDVFDKDNLMNEILEDKKKELMMYKNDMSIAEMRIEDLQIQLGNLKRRLVKYRQRKSIVSKCKQRFKKIKRIVTDKMDRLKKFLPPILLKVYHKSLLSLSIFFFLIILTIYGVMI